MAMPKERKPAHEESPCYATAMRKASRRLTQLYDDALEESGLRSTQFAILAELDRRSKEPPTMAELAMRTGHGPLGDRTQSEAVGARRIDRIT